MIMQPLHGQSTAALRKELSGQALPQKIKTRGVVFVKQADAIKLA
jgi:hypothetical protein